MVEGTGATDRGGRGKSNWARGQELASSIKEEILSLGSDGKETLWNKLVPKKVNISVWRALKERLPVHVELDRRCVNLNSVLCSSCNNIMESRAHNLITCDLSMSVCDKIFKWWKMWNINAFSIDEFISLNGNVNVPTFVSRVW
ncbi:RNA-directed DNA polymerase, eukaryota, reverse transcriptase zinc-binding domain protein [Tanacetum coccineum]